MTHTLGEAREAFGDTLAAGPVLHAAVRRVHRAARVRRARRGTATLVGGWRLEYKKYKDVSRRMATRVLILVGAWLFGDKDVSRRMAT